MSYYIDLHLITLVAFVPDPKYKLEGLPAYLDAYYKFLGFNRNQDSQLQSIKWIEHSFVYPRDRLHYRH